MDMATGKSADLQKNTLESQYALARLGERRGEADQAEAKYRELLEKAPDDARIHHRLGVLAVRKGDFVHAEEYFQKARSLATPTAELLNDIGYCYYLQHKLPEAETTLNEALKLEPTNAAAVNNLALVLGRSGRVKESLELFKRNNSEAEACANLAYVLAQNGDMAQAREMYLRALTLDNRMRAAAQAVLQIDERQEAEQRLASARQTSLASQRPVRLPQVGQEPRSAGWSGAEARTLEVQQTQAIMEPASGSSNALPQATQIPCYVDNRSS
jgi:Flp pilus assembly protein TadD